MSSKGEAHLVGNGYSLTIETLESLKGKVSFAMNGIALEYHLTDWRPTYYVMFSTRANGDRVFRSLVLHAISECQTAYIDSMYADNDDFNRLPNVIFVNTKEKLLWSDNLERIGKYATGMFVAIEIAAILGYSPLYLYGVDGYRCKDGGNHFCSEYFTGVIPNVDEENENMRQAYKFIKEHCPVRIIDRTASAGFGIFERES